MHPIVFNKTTKTLFKEYKQIDTPEGMTTRFCIQVKTRPQNGAE